MIGLGDGCGDCESNPCRCEREMYSMHQSERPKEWDDSVYIIMNCPRCYVNRKVVKGTTPREICTKCKSKDSQ